MVHYYTIALAVVTTIGSSLFAEEKVDFSAGSDIASREDPSTQTAAVATVSEEEVLGFGHERHTDFEIFSDNRNYKVKVTSPNKEKQTKSRIVVSQKKGKEWREMWVMTSVNSVQPAAAFITNDGSRVVTIGDWLGRSNGDHDLVVYQDGKVLKHYARTEIVKENNIYTLARGIHSGWWYDIYSYIDKNKQFCLWVDSASQWVLVDLTDAALIKADREILQRCEKRLRSDMYANLSQYDALGGHKYADYRRLARFLRPKDRPTFERLLEHPDRFACAFSLSFDGSEFYYLTNNEYRTLAEFALVALDAGKTDAIRDVNSWIQFRKNGYPHLGSLRISTTFEEAPRKGNGCLVLWLEAIDGNMDDAKTDKRPAHVIGIDFSTSVPTRMVLADEPLDSPVSMNMYAITPGKYRIRGYWDKDAKYLSKLAGDFWKRSGNFKLAENPVVDLQAGRILNAAITFTKNSTTRKPIAEKRK